MKENNKNNKENYENLFSTEAEELDSPVTEEEEDTVADEALDVEDEEIVSDEDTELADDEDDAEAEDQPLSIEKKSKSGNLILPIALIVLAAAIIVAVVVFAMSGKGGKNDKENGTEGTSGITSTQTDKPENKPSASEKYDGGVDVNAEKVSAYTENYKLTNAEMMYIVNASYANFVSTVEYYGQYYGMSLESLGLDPSKSIKDQKCSFDGFEGTWYEYFFKDAKATVDEMLAVCEAGRAAGHKLTAEEQKQIDDTLAQITTEAQKAGLSVDAYLAKNYGTGTTSQVITTIMEYSLYASSYLSKVQNDADVSDAALEAKYNSNPNAVDTVDFILCSFDFNDLLPKDADDAAKEEAKNKCRRIASEIAKMTTKEEFIAKIKDVLVNEFGQTAAEAEKSVAAITYKGQKYSDDVVFNWAFGDVSVGDTKVFEDEPTGMIAAGFFLGRNVKSEAPVKRDVYHILFSNETYKDDSVAKQVYNDWIAGGATLDSFKKLAEKYTEDPGSKKTGGLYEDVAPGDMVDEFNDWLFDPARKEGEHGIVKTSYGWHIMYTGAAEGVQWKETTKALIQTEAITAVQKSAAETYKVTYDEAILATLPL